jgi:hypothetical protein
VKTKTSVALLFVILHSAVYSFSQKHFTAADLYAVPAIHLCGLDFSHAQIYHEKPRNEEYLRKTLFGEYSTRFLTEETDLIHRKLDKEIHILPGFLPDTTSAREGSLKDTGDIFPILKKYRIAEPEGIGLVFIARVLSRKEHFTTFYGVFFDLASRKPLLVYEVKGKLGRGSVEQYWWYSIENAVKAFCRKYSRSIY